MTATAGVAQEPSTSLRDQLLTIVSSLGDEKARLRFFRDNPEYARPEVVQCLAEFVPALIRSDRSSAAAAAECAVLLARKLQNPASTALALRARANVMHVNGRNVVAVRLHNRAYSLFAKAGDHQQAARTLSASIQPLILIGEYDRALAAAAEAKRIFRRASNPWRLARVELNTGNIYDRQDRFREALKSYQRAHDYLQAHEDEDPEAVAIALHNMAGCQVLLNDFRGAVATYEKARAVAERRGMPGLVLQAEYNLAWLHHLRGEYSRAIHLLRTARDASEKNGDRHHFALCHLDLSEIYLELKMGSEAEESASLARDTFGAMRMRYEEAKASANIAIALTQQGRVAEALPHFCRARELFVLEKNKTWCALLNLFQAIALLRNNEDLRAQPLAIAALHSFRGAPHYSKAVQCRLLLARIALRAGQLDAATQQASRALSCLKRIESPSLSCQAHALAAQIEKARGRSSAAYKHYQAAKNNLENLRRGIYGDELKISFMRDRVEIYEGLVHLCMTRPGDHVREAMTYIEQAKSRSLLDLLATVDIPRPGLVTEDDDSLRRVRNLRAELNWYQHRLEIEQLQSRGRSSQQVHQLRVEARRREREMLRLMREAHAATPTTSELELAANRTPEQLQEGLNPAITIVEYFKVHEDLVVALFSRDRLELEILCPVDSINADLAGLRLQLAKLRLGSDYVSTFEGTLLRATKHHLHALYNKLIAPVRSRLRTPHLAIAPQGTLHHLPFHALFDGQRYLVDDYILSYAPSASIYALCEARRQQATGPGLVVGVPDPTIPMIEEEVTAVAQILRGSRLIVGAGATAEALAREAGESSLIHIATHGRFREDEPMFSGIHLADSWLSVYDLLQFRLPADLITLSGCSTGLNVVSAGDEIMGLVRGLIGAGARSALLSLWDVFDQTTTDFMKSFYSGLAAGKNRAQAVRESSLKLRESHPHPYYWAPFFLVGKVFSRHEQPC